MPKPPSPDLQRSSITSLLTFLVVLGLFLGILTLLKNPEVNLKDPIEPRQRSWTMQPHSTPDVPVQRYQDPKPPSDPAATLYEDAKVAIQEKSDYESARVLLQKALEKDPNHIAAADEFFNVSEQLGDYEGALAILQKLETESSDATHVGLDYAQARLYLQFGHPDEARARLEQILESGTPSPMVHEQLALAYASLGERELARREWLVLAQDERAGPASWKAKEQLAELLFLEGREEEADPYIRELLQRDPQNKLGVLLSGR